MTERRRWWSAYVWNVVVTFAVLASAVLTGPKPAWFALGVAFVFGAVCTMGLIRWQVQRGSRRAGIDLEAPEQGAEGQRADFEIRLGKDLVDGLLLEIGRLKATNTRLNRRCQRAEAALHMRAEDLGKRSKPALRSYYFHLGREYERERCGVNHEAG